MQVFISYAQVDGEVARDVARRLESEGYSTWYYERDTVGGESHLELTANAICEAQAFIVIISERSCISEEVKSEFYAARARKKLIIPLRYGITHDEFMSQFPSWHAALGGRVEIDVASNIKGAIDGIVKSLRTSKISPGMSDSVNPTRPGTVLPPPPKPPQTKAPQSKAPQTKSPQTKSPQTKSPQTKSPQTKASQTKTSRPKPPPPKSPVPRKEAVEPRGPSTHGASLAGVESPPSEETLEITIKVKWRKYALRASAAAVGLLAGCVGIWSAWSYFTGSSDTPGRSVASLPKKKVVGPVDPEPKPPKPPAKEPEKDVFAVLADCEREVKEYVKQDYEEAVNAKAKAIADAAEAWLQQEKPRVEREREALSEQAKAVREMQDRLRQLEARLEEKPDATDAAAVAAYDRLVKEGEELANQYITAGEAYKTAEAAHNGRVEAFNKELERRQAELTAAQEAVSKPLAEYSDWLKKGGTETLWLRLCTCFADLKVMDRSSADNLARVQDGLERARNVRREMAEFLKAQEDASDSGFLIVEAEIQERDKSGESCYLAVHNTSTVCSLSPEIVDALNLGEFQGSETKLSLPDGSETHVPQLLIPRIGVHDQTALFVRGVVLPKHQTGTDGRLGLSFLHRFDYTIEGGRRRELLLRPSNAGESAEAYEVFICHHADDLALAREVYQMLTEKKRQVFFSQVSLRRSTAAEFQEAVHKALAGASHMVVVCSTADHVKTPWVEAEWRLFDRLKTSGEKQGNMVAVVSDCQASDLPAPLNGYQVVSTDNDDWNQTLVDHLKR